MKSIVYVSVYASIIEMNKFYYAFYTVCQSCVKIWFFVEWYTVETRYMYNEILGTGKFCLLYQIFCYISTQQTYKTKQINSLGPEKMVCYIRYSGTSF